MTNYLRISVIAVLALVGFWPAASLDARITEPVIADYSKIPVFSSLETPPNIMVIFDSSGTMALNAYGAVKENNTFRDDIYVPLYGKEVTLSYYVSSGADDAREFWQTGLVNNNVLHLDLGRAGKDRGGRVLKNLVGMRFENIALEQDADIVSAYLEVEAAPTSASAQAKDLVMVISAESNPASASFANLSKNISDRDDTQNKQFWSNPANSWVEGNLYKIPDLDKVVKEVVNNPAWVNGNNSITFKLTYGSPSATAQRNVVSYEGWRHDPSASKPRLVITAKSEIGTRYYGYFNSDWIYTSDTKEFTHKYKKISYVGASTFPGGLTDPDYLNLQTKSGCNDGDWWVRYPADYSSPETVETTWAEKCISDTDFSTEVLYDGNWMNWATTRRIDVSRKVLTGGLGAKNGFGQSVLSGDNPPDTDAEWKVRYNSVAAGNYHAVTPFVSIDPLLPGYDYEINTTGGGGVAGLFVDPDRTHELAVIQSPDFDPDSFIPDPDNPTKGKLGGILQTFWTKALWGLTTFQTEDNSGGNIQYGTKEHPNNANYMSAINHVVVESWSPLAESLYSVVQYFKGEDPESNLGYPNPSNHNPFLRNNNIVACVNNFVLVISDGISSADSRVPDSFKDIDGDGDEACSNNDAGCLDNYDGELFDPLSPTTGSDYMDDIALYAHTTDLRPPYIDNKGVEIDELEGDQVLDIYTVFAAFGADPTTPEFKAARNLMIDTAINGGFEDQDGDGKPTFTDDNGDAVVDPSDNDGDFDPAPFGVPYDPSIHEATSTEFDKHGVGLPDNYFEATDGAELKKSIYETIAAILAKSASGTAVSVLATSSEGEGTLIQAYFKPKTTGDVNATGDLNDKTEMKWAGYLQALWVDSYGNIREDTGTPLTLDEGNDKVITFLVENGDTKVNKFAVSTLEPDTANPDRPGKYPSTDMDVNSDYERSAIGTVVPIWEAGEVLAGTTADPNPPLGVPKRRIFTSTDDSHTSYLGGVEFVPNNANHLRPYFGVYDDDTWQYLGLTINDRAVNLINYTRGYDDGFIGGASTSTRNRTIWVNNFSRVWKLGDIVNSTPVTIQQPPDNYDFIYADRDYAAYKKDKIVRWEGGELKGWETMVYVGANDGMLHAFTGWKYDKDAKTFKQPGIDDALGHFVDGTYVDGEEIGQELWAYIPRALLPHLKWYPDPGYIHTYYVDLRPKVVDVHGFDDPCTHTGSPHIKGWGTVLIGGLRMGGKEILTEEDFDADGDEEVETFTSSYFAIDITDPRNPELMWEKSYDDLGLTTSEPTIMKVGDLVPSPDLGDDKWYIVFGSGPNDPADTTSQGAYEGVSDHEGRVYVVDVFTGEPAKGNGGTTDYLFSTAEDKTFMGGAAGVDKFLNFNVDAVYIGAAHDNGGNPDWTGSMYKITVPWRSNVTPGDMTNYGNTDPAVGEFVADPLDFPAGTDPWSFSKMFVSPGPITAPPSLSIDTKQNTWVYFGTGRYMSIDDKTTDDPQYLFGIKDPFFNFQALDIYPSCCSTTCASDPNCDRYSDDYFMNYSNNLTLGVNNDYAPGGVDDDLFDSDTYKVFFPWTGNPSVAGDPATCVKSNEPALNPLYKIGDILGDDSCVAYNWWCEDTGPTGCATAPGLTYGDMGPAGDGIIYLDGDLIADCNCHLDTAIPTTWGTWGVLSTSGDQADCVGINSGELGNVYGDGTCIGMNWEAHGDGNILATEHSCDGVSFGTVGTGLGDGHCDATSNVGVASPYTVDTTKAPDLWYYVRPATPDTDGDGVADICENVDPNFVGSIYEAGATPPFGSYCFSTFWTCKEDGEAPLGDCALKRKDGSDGADIDFHASSGVDAPSLSTDVDKLLVGGDAADDCICSFSQEPVAHVKYDADGDPVTGSAFNDVTQEVYSFFDILDAARMEDGWFRRLATPRERSVTKPGLIGGISLFTSYVPNEDVCAFGGDSYLYALYYETGTAYREKVIGWEIDAAGDLTPSDRMRLGTGLASSVGLHIGLQEENTATGFVQQSTGAITKLRIDPAFEVRSGLTSWRDN